MNNTGANGGARERRNSGRFPMREDLTYRIIQNRVTISSGVGTTVNMGSGGILFLTQDHLPPGRMVELAVNWPARLDGTCPLKMVARGRVVRSESGRTAVRIERYEFRTRGQSAMAAAG
jgi:hypothetical protein